MIEHINTKEKKSIQTIDFVILFDLENRNTRERERKFDGQVLAQ